MLKFNVRQLALCVVAAVFATPAAADTYRWVDENGVVNYSERKPHGVDAELISMSASSKPATAPISAAPATAPAYASSTQSGGQPGQENLSPEQQQMLAELQQNEADRQQQVEKIRQDNCERSRRVLQNLTSRGRIRINQEDGAQRVMPEEERQQRIGDAQQGIAANCDS